MFTRIVVGVDCREGGRDALALATLLHAAGWGELVALHAGTSAPLIHEDVLILVEAELARAGATGRARRRHRPLARSRTAHHRRARGRRAHRGRILAPRRRRPRPGGRRRGRDAALRAVRGGRRSAGLARLAGALRRIGVGFDDSQESRVALAVARRVATARAPTCAPSRCGPRPSPLWPAIAWDTAWAGRGRRRRSTAERLARRHQRGGRRRRRRHEDDGRHAVEGARRAQRATWTCSWLARGRTGRLRRLLLGSTSTRLARHAACPLLVAPRRAHGTADASRSPARRRAR